MKYSKSLFIPLLALACASCSKRDMVKPENDPGKLKGDWRVVGIHLSAKTQVSDQESITFGEYSYDAEIKSGETTIDNSNFNIKQLSYGINTLMHVTYRFPGEEDMVMDVPLSGVIPAYDGTQPYRLIGADSIYFENGFIPDPANVDGSLGIQTRGGGGRISWSKDTLVLTCYISSNDEHGIVSGIGIEKLVRK